ncbi:MAG TPA: hypothetical protein VGL99_23785 [Chloroflexota bacterium]
MNQSQASLPSFTGLQVHHDQRLGFSVLIPDGWVRLDVEGSPGAFFAPDPADLTTGMAVEGRDLGTEVSPTDLASLRRGFLRGLRELSECHIESRSAEAVGALITMEARHTYKDGHALRKRWVRLLYQGRTQVRLIAQAASPEQFAFWEPMFYTTIRTMRFGSFA